MNAITTAFRAEFVLLNRTRVWVIAGLTTVAFTIAATALVVATAEPAATSPEAGIPLEALIGPGGATAAVTWSFAFGFILILAAFTSKIGNEFARGTLRTSLLQHPRRCSLVAGKVAALMTVTVGLLVVGLGTGAATAAVVASAEDIDTTGWFGADALGDALGDFARMTGWAAGWAIFGTLLAVLLRSTPVAIGAGVLWFGPVENVIGENQRFAQRWFPGQLLRAISAPDAPDVVATATAAATLTVYAVVSLAVIAVVVTRRDVTA